MTRAWLGLIVALLVCLPARGQGGLGPALPDAEPAPAAPARAPALPTLSEADPYNPLAILAGAGEALPGVGAGGKPAGEAPRGGLSVAINILVVLTVLSLVPAIMLMTTCFMRILIVLGLLKQALGAQSVPPPQVVTGLALFMTLLVMTPTLERINKEAIGPYRAGQVADYDDLWNRTRQPMRDFMFAQIEATGNWSSVYMIMEYRGQDLADPSALTRADVDMVTLVPAYMLSELKVAFLLGFKVYLPFLVIDMVVSTMLISMSMMMLPPVLISLPFKLLLFVLVDGWVLIVGGLMQSFAVSPAEVAAMAPSSADVLALVHALSPGGLVRV
ncbi:MAG: flagellar biosynthetic protein FliP [Leptolyngbya sp. PLA1]|nr:flagellar biosynthetic protein FliP [Leptolyngbya sp. PLA1]